MSFYLFVFFLCFFFVFLSFCPFVWTSIWSNVWRVSSLKSHSLCRNSKVEVTQWVTKVRYRAARAAKNKIPNSANLYTSYKTEKWKIRVYNPPQKTVHILIYIFPFEKIKEPEKPSFQFQNCTVYKYLFNWQMKNQNPKLYKSSYIL